jgi:hypothetical protein
MHEIMPFGAFCRHPDFLGPFLGPTFDDWLTIYEACDAAPCPSDRARAFWEKVAGCPWPTEVVYERVQIAGRRSGKGRMATAYCTFEAAMRDRTDELALGEWNDIMLLAPTTLQADKNFEYILGYFTEVPALAALVTRTLSDTIELSNHNRISVRVANPRTLRGATSSAILMDEAAFMQSDITGACNDREIARAAVPCLSSLHGRLIVTTTPYGTDSYVYEMHDRYAAVDGVRPNPNIVSFIAATRTLNSTFDQRIIDRALAEDAESARSEYMGCWRTPISKLFSRDLITSLVMKDVDRIQPREDVVMKAAYDASGGLGDSAVLAIAASFPDGRATLLLLHEELAPHSPMDVIRNVMAPILRNYDICNVVGDKYSGTMVADEWGNCGVSYEFSEVSKSEAYVASIPLFSGGRVALLDNKRLVDQFCSLERRTTKNTGRDQVDHPSTAGARDDCSNAAVLALLQVAEVRNVQERWDRMAEGSENFLNYMKLQYGFPAGF